MYLHAALVERCQNVKMIYVGIAQAFPVIDQQHCGIVKIILRDFIMMTIAVVHKEIEDRRVDQIQESARRLRRIGFRVLHLNIKN